LNALKRRDALLVLSAVILAVGVAGLLLVGTLTTPARGEGRPSFFFGGQRVPAPRSIDVVQRQAPESIRMIVPIQRGVSDNARDAAGYLLVLLGVSAALVLAREPVLATYRAALGGWRAQARVLATGIAVLGLTASTVFLLTVVMLGTVSNGPFGDALGSSLRSLLFQPFLQGGLIAVVVAVVFVSAVALVGFSAAAWRLGDAIFGLRPLQRWATAMPAPLVALIGASVVYVAAQLPIVGPIFGVLALAYALGAAVTARIGHPEQAVTATA
jgi:hypothetical protein